MTSKQLAYYYRHKERINANRRQVKRKGKTENSPRRQGKTKAVKRIDGSLIYPKVKQTEPIKLRLHRLQRTYIIINAVSEDKLRALKLNDKLINIKQWLGAGFRIIRGNGWTLELEGIELISHYRLPSALLKAQALTLCDNIAAQLAFGYGFVIAKEGNTPPTLTEIEMSSTEMTQRLKNIEKTKMLDLYTDAQGYKIWVDWSFGIGGLESNNTIYLQRLQDFAHDLAEIDLWSIMKENSKDQIRFNDRTLDNFTEMKLEIQKLKRHIYGK